MVKLNNSDNKYYSTKFQFGSNNQKIQLVVDTQTDWTIVLAAECATCSQYTDRFDRTASATASTSTTIKTTRIPFGDSGYLVGRTTIDKCCMKTSSSEPDTDYACTQTDHTFFEVKSFENVNMNPSYSGIMGMAPDDP